MGAWGRDWSYDVWEVLENWGACLPPARYEEKEEGDVPGQRIGEE